MDIKNITEWIQLAWIVASGIILIITLILGLARAKAKKKGDVKFVENTDTAFNLLNTTRKAMQTAEKLTGMNGGMKKEFVITKVNQACLNAGIAFNEAETSKLIEDLIEVSKTINKREDEKEIQEEKQEEIP